MYLNKKMDIGSAYSLVQVTALLLIFMRPSEAFYIVDQLVKRSWQTFKSLNQDELRWFVAPDRSSYNKLLTTYVNINLTAYGKIRIRKRRMIKHLGQIGFDMTILADSFLKNFGMDFLGLEHLTDQLMVYLCEGVKSQFRFIYGLLKCQ
jgi:hypothetical protein